MNQPFEFKARSYQTFKSLTPTSHIKLKTENTALTAQKFNLVAQIKKADMENWELTERLKVSEESTESVSFSRS